MCEQIEFHILSQIIKLEQLIIKFDNMLLRYYCNFVYFSREEMTYYSYKQWGYQPKHVDILFYDQRKNSSWSYQQIWFVGFYSEAESLWVSITFGLSWKILLFFNTQFNAFQWNLRQSVIYIEIWVRSCSPFRFKLID